MEGEGVMEGKACPAKKSGHSSAGCLCNKYERSECSCESVRVSRLAGTFTARFCD